jgi:hypothetical protein
LEVQECNQQFLKNCSLYIGKSQRLHNEGNARIYKVPARSSGLAKIIENVHISRHFEIGKTDIPKVVNACSIDYADIWFSKLVGWL